MPPVSASSTCFALRAERNGKYLQSVFRKKADGSRVEASADTVAGNARTRFLMEPSEEIDGLMHIRCCYNNQYWAAVQVQDGGRSRWIIGTSDEPGEDTLFQALPFKDKYNCNSFRFRHSGLRKFARALSIGDKIYLQLDRDDQENMSDNFIVSFPPHKELPKHVAFKGDNGKYLGSDLLGTWGTLGFSIMTIFSLNPGPIFVMFSIRNHLYFHVKDIKDARAIFTTFTNADGTVRIKSSTGQFWKRSDDVIALLGEDDNDRDSLFEVVTRDGFVALRNLGNKKFCRAPLDHHASSTGLTACDDDILQWAKVEAPPFVSREISVVKFHLDEARIYNKKIINISSDTRTNNGSREIKGIFSFKKTLQMDSKREYSVSSKMGVTVNNKFQTSGVPVIVTRGLTISNEYTTAEGRIIAQGNAEEITLTQEYCMLPGTTVVGDFVAKRASCDVPYTYKQTDVLTTGDVVTTMHDDGIFTVDNNYDFEIIVNEYKTTSER